MGIFIPTKLNSDYGLSVIMKKIQKLHKLKLAWIFRLKAFVEADFELEIKKNKKDTFNHESRCP